MGEEREKNRRGDGRSTYNKGIKLAGTLEPSSKQNFHTKIDEHKFTSPA